jgi:hypothetical protein
MLEIKVFDFSFFQDTTLLQETVDIFRLCLWKFDSAIQEFNNTEMLGVLSLSIPNWATLHISQRNLPKCSLVTQETRKVKICCYEKIALAAIKRERFQPIINKWKPNYL